jgi:hypothetical protein
MDEKRLASIGYAQGWVETFMSQWFDLAEDKRYAQEAFDAYMLVSAGFDELRRENADLTLKLMMARNAIQ